MEYWGRKADDVLILISDQWRHYRNGKPTSNRVFQHSIIPIPHCIWLRQSLLSL